MDLKSNEPFWLIKNGLISSYPSLKEDKKCDVLIIGGGITGSLISHQMIKDGYSTILIDKREICNGSTSATTSMLQYEIDVPLYKMSQMIGEKAAVECYKACEKSINDIAELVKTIKSRSGFRKKMSLYYAARKKDADWLEQEFEARRKAGFEVEYLSSREIERRYEITNTYGGILSKSGGSIDAFKFSHELLRFNEKSGIEIYDKTELRSVKYLKDHNLALTTSGFTIAAKKIIYCVGYEAKELIKENFVNLKSTFALVSEVNPKGFKSIENMLIWNTDEPYLYMRSTDDGRFLIGGGDEDFDNAEKRDALLGKKEKEILRNLKRIKPGEHFYTDFVWAGTFGETDDGLPYIGGHKNFKNSYFVCGFGGNGITFSVTGMEMASAFMKGKKHPLSEYFKFGR
ncbi:FAD-dependent oxidoreductase [Chryseobacterium sp. Leaf404]|uniref:NAD(P)/FAD-dependent oxidoreductase n=1 Tax=unclassified Chryseobacterium TaxID=2593645 RepID=UPI0006FA6801|nr:MULTISPECIES: FAD-binding oxidoreductase [unclassified Chryseobacterium]KQT17643.1 FAD-dependent oxidoreductase [Chryseobacterium sp. Leaf404]